jgi:outer membrane protein TolC
MKPHVLLLLTLGSALVAAEPLTIQSATERALAGNPRLLAAKLDAVAAQRRTQQSVGRRFGDLDLVGQYNNFEDDRILRPMAKQLMPITAMPFDRNQVHYGISWQIPLLAGGTLREGDRIARLSQEATEKMALFTKEEIRYNVRAAYRNALVLRHAVAAAEAFEQALAEDHAQAQLLVKTGRWAAVDAAKVDYTLQDAHARRAGLQAQSDGAQTLLAALMGLDSPAEPFVLQDVEDQPQALPQNGAALKEEAIRGRQDLLAIQASTAIAERKKVQAQWSFGPSLGLSGNYLKNEAPSVQGSFDTHELTLSLKIPIFDGGRRLHALSEARANLEASKQRERAKTLEVETQVEDALGRLRAARAQLEAGQAQRSLGSEVARVEHLKLEQGSGRIEDYLAARAQELAGDTAYWQGLYALQTAVDYCNFVTGKGEDHD